MNYPDRGSELGKWVKSLIVATMIMIVALAILELFNYIPRTQSAPAPLPRCHNLPSGAYALKFGNAEYSIILYKNSDYEATQGSSRWIGCWEWDSIGRILIIRERADNTVDQLMVWKIILDNRLVGSLDGQQTPVTLTLKARHQ